MCIPHARKQPHTHMHTRWLVQIRSLMESACCAKCTHIQRVLMYHAPRSWPAALADDVGISRTRKTCFEQQAAGERGCAIGIMRQGVLLKAWVESKRALTCRSCSTMNQHFQGSLAENGLQVRALDQAVAQGSLLCAECGRTRSPLPRGNLKWRVMYSSHHFS